MSTPVIILTLRGLGDPAPTSKRSTLIIATICVYIKTLSLPSHFQNSGMITENSYLLSSMARSVIGTALDIVFLPLEMIF